jgi:hypothetical protein
LDWKLHCVVILPYYGKGPNDGTILAEMKAEIRTNQAKVEANIKEIKEEIRIKEVKEEAMIQNNQQILDKTDTTDLEANREKVEACLEKTVAYLERKEPIPEEIEGVAEHEEVHRRPWWKLSEP